MTEPETSQPVADAQTVPPAADQTEGEAGIPPAPEPEPWTPERVTEWNAYYDLFVAFAALLLALVVACNYVTDSRLFLHLRTGQLIGERMAPVMTDEFSFTQTGQPWVDVPWLFQWSHATLYNLIYGAVPVDPLDQTANLGKADRIAIGALVLLDALVRAVTVFILLKLRHRGPGLWWSAVCATLALGVFYDPLVGLAPGGIASIPGIGTATSGILPSSWGMLFLALELLLVFRALEQGRARYIWGLVPLFVLWANWDVSFLTGLVVLAAFAAGHWLDGGALTWHEEPTPAEPDASEKKSRIEPHDAAPGRLVGPPVALLVTAVCALACLVNPWTYRAYQVAVDPFVHLFWGSKSYQFIDALSFFSPRVPMYLQAFFFILVALGLGSFVLNIERFSWRRFIPYAVVSLLWACLLRFSVEFAIVFAMVVALNGQEWYLDRFGPQGRLGSGWTLWSTGGRMVTLVLIFLVVGIDITGWGVYKRGVHFGLGYNPDQFPLEAAEFLERQSELRGNVFNPLFNQGDMLIWKAFPKRKTYVDSRSSFFSRALLEEREQLRAAIRDDDVATWKPILDRYKIDVVMIDPVESSKTYEKLMGGVNWIPFYDDGQVAMFGRKDAPAEDLAFFNANRLEPSMVYRATNPVPPVAGPPTATSWIDDVFQNRNLDRSQARTQAAGRWLMTGAADGSRGLPEPARCLLAIQNARIALSRNADDTVAFRVLAEAYRLLALQESALMAGIPLTPENAQRISMIVPPPDRLINRYRQRVTSLNYLLQTSPTPSFPEARDELFDWNRQLYELYMSANFVDLARDRLRAALALNPTENRLPPENRAALKLQLDKLDEAVKQVSDKLDDVELEQQPRVVDLANYARQQGAVGLAISRLETANDSGDSPAVVKPLLLELYCVTGQPDKALDLIGVGSIGDPNLGTEPGVAIYRQALVYFLLGNYTSAASLHERAILQVRMERSNRAVAAGRNLIRGEALAATNLYLGVPNSIEQQAAWEFEAGLCLLEGGQPVDAAKHLTNALTLEPNLTVRPIAAYYLEKLGKPVPPRRETPGATKPAATATPATGPSLDASKPLTPAASPAPAPGTPAAAPEPKATPPAEPKAKPAAEPAKTQPAAKPDAAKAPAKKAG